MRCSHCGRELTREQFASYSGGLCDPDCYQIGQTKRLEWLRKMREEEKKSQVEVQEEYAKKKKREWDASYLLDTTEEGQDNKEMNELLLGYGL